MNDRILIDIGKIEKGR